MGSPTKPLEIISLLLLITAFVPHTVTTQNVVATNTELEEVKNNDDAKIDVPINEQEGKF